MFLSSPLLAAFKTHIISHYWLCACCSSVWFSSCFKYEIFDQRLSMYWEDHPGSTPACLVDTKQHNWIYNWFIGSYDTAMKVRLGTPCTGAFICKSGCSHLERDPWFFSDLPEWSYSVMCRYVSKSCNQRVTTSFFPLSAVVSIPSRISWTQQQWNFFISFPSRVQICQLLSLEQWMWKVHCFLMHLGV